LSEFHKAKGSKGGLQSYCKQCIFEYHAEYLPKNRDKQAVWERKYREKLKDGRRLKGHDAKYNARQKSKRKAQRILLKAIKSGTIIKADECIMPDCDCTENIEGHHHDYSRPLEVLWLCCSCHMTYHRGKTKKAERVRAFVDNYITEHFKQDLSREL
jgi:hypothetical protein